MSELCRICLTRPNEWAESSLTEHLRAEHTRASVESEYPNRVEELFDGGGEVDTTDADDEGATDADDEGALPDDDGGAGGDGIDVIETGSTADEPSTHGRKWFVVGIGGAGNHILDALLLRRETLRRNDDPFAQVWEGGLAGYLSLNTNIAELRDTYYADVDRGFDLESIEQNGIIAYKVHDGTGAGRQWTVGRDLMEWDFDGERNAIRDRWPVNEQQIKDAQAVMLLHSVTKGTGSGATPVLAEKIRSEVLGEERIVPKPILSSVVVPKESESGSSEMIRGVIGIARMSRAANGILPFGNEQLEELTHSRADDPVEVDGIEQYAPNAYTEINKVLVEFMEAFTMSSTPQLRGDVIRGETFDVRDSYAPMLNKYEGDEDREYKPAVMMAPVLGHSRMSSFDRSSLETLARKALLQGQMIPFDPSTSWGGTFLVYGPEDAMEEIEPLVTRSTFQDVLGGEDLLDVDNVDGSSSIDIYVDQLVVPDASMVSLWGLVWNPKLPPLEKMYEYARQRKEEGSDAQSETLREYWDLIEPVFGALGRENMG